MAFIRVDKERIKRKGAVYIARAGELEYIVGRTQGSNKTAAALQVAAQLVEKGAIPRIEVVKFKKVTDTYKVEALLHATMFEFRVSGQSYYLLTEEEMKSIWKDIV